MKTHTKRFKIYLLILTMFLFAGFVSLSGCGGGSYSGSGSSLSIGGKVIDGAVDNAAITVYDVTSNDLVEAGSGFTGGDGSFSITISNYNSSDYYILYVSGGTFDNNGNTTTTAPIMVGFLVPGGSPTVYISPLTTLIGELLFNSNGTLDTSLNSTQVSSILKQMLSVLSNIFNGMSGNTLSGISSSDPTQSPLFQELLTLLQDLANQIKSQTGENYNQAMDDLLKYLGNPNNQGGQQLEAALEPGGNGGYYFMNFTYTGNGGGAENIIGTLDTGDQTGLGNLEKMSPPSAGLSNIAATFSVPTNFSVWVLNAPSAAGGNGTVTKLDSTGNVKGTYTVGPDPQSIAIDSSGNIWVAGDAVLTELSSAGAVEATCYLDTGGVTDNPNYSDTNYIAIDSSNTVWVTSSLGSNYTAINEIQAGYSNSPGVGHYWENGRITSGGNFGHGAIFELNYHGSNPCSIVQNIDVEQATKGAAWGADAISIGANGYIWIISDEVGLFTENGINNIWGTYYPDALLTEFDQGGTFITQPTPSSTDYNPLGGISTDPSGNIWVEGVSNYAWQTRSYVSANLFENGSFSSQSFSLQPCSSSVNSIGIDPSGNVWTACGYGDSDVYEYKSSGSQLNKFNMATTVAGFTAISGSTAIGQLQGQIAFDPSGNAWIIGTGDNNAYGVIVINPKSGSQAFYKTSLTSPPVAIAIESYPVPTVTSVNPANSTIGVGASTTISATFSEAMDSSTINTNTFTLTDANGASVPGTVAYDSSNDTATFTPSSSLSSGITYTADITTGAESSQEIALSSTYSWSFTTAFAASGGTKTFTVGTGPMNIAIDASGNIWVTNEGGGGSVTELNLSGGLLNTFSGNNISDPVGIAIDSSGNVWVANWGSTNVTELLKSSNYSSQQTFSIGLPELNSIAIDASGNIWVTDTYGGYDDVFELLGPSYSSNNSFAVGSGGGKATGIAIDKSGNVWIAYSAYGYGSLTELLGPNYSSSNPYNDSNLKDPAEVAINSGGNVWVTNNGSSDNTVVEFPYPSYSPSTAYITGSSPTSPTGVAIDANQNVWVTNYGDGTVSEFSSGALIHSYSVGTKPTGIAIDSSGNVWVANYGDGTVTELIGVAAGPQYFPYSGPQFP